VCWRAWLSFGAHPGLSWATCPCSSARSCFHASSVALAASADSLKSRFSITRLLTSARSRAVSPGSVSSVGAASSPDSADSADTADPPDVHGLASRKSSPLASGKSSPQLLRLLARAAQMPLTFSCAGKCASNLAGTAQESECQLARCQLARCPLQHVGCLPSSPLLRVRTPHPQWHWPCSPPIGPLGCLSRNALLAMRPRRCRSTTSTIQDCVARTNLSCSYLVL